MPLKPKQIVKILKKNGYVIKSQNGSHLKMYNPKSKQSIIVPMHSKELKLGLEKQILKQINLKGEDQ